MKEITGAVWLPLLPDERDFLEHTLRSAAVLTPGNYDDPSGPSLATYISNARIGGVEFRALFDRNLISPIARLASGMAVPSNPQEERITRLACAAFSFCIWADILIEPSMALYEYASSMGHPSALQDLRHFRIADNADPRLLFDIAAGLSDALPVEHLEEVAQDPGIQALKPREDNFAKTLTPWRPNYLCVLKTLDLLRSGLKPIDAACALLAWQTRESFFNGVALMYCLAAMSHRPPKGGMLKGVKSTNISMLRDGAVNATWDICLLKQFGSYVIQSDSPSWSLWSDDFALKSIARSLFIPSEASELDKLHEFFLKTWGKDGPLLFSRYVQFVHEANVGSPERKKHTKDAFDRVEEDIGHLESSLGLHTIPTDVKRYA